MYDLLTEMGVTYDKVRSEIDTMREGRTISEKDTEGKSDILEKFTTDLTELARKGALDPVIGREKEINRIIQILSRRRKNNPVVIGEPGFGKTELAKALTEFLLDDENRLIRLGMSEYMEKHSVSKIIGSPPGYVGYDEGGQLTEKVRRHPLLCNSTGQIGKSTSRCLQYSATTTESRQTDRRAWSYYQL
ncbi:MAG: AAA domain-containing protein [Nitrospinae bacterium]|nr:AAA domain-containing protein [Nitrospinota bacterium]